MGIFSIFENLIKELKLKILSDNDDSKKYVKVEGDGNQVINNFGSTVPKEKPETTTTLNNKKTLLSKMCEEVLSNTEKFAPLDIIQKSLIIAKLNNDNKAFEQFSNELYGFPSDYDKDLPHRIVDATLNVVFSFYGYSPERNLDLSKKPMQIILTTGLTSIYEHSQKDPSSGLVVLFAPIPQSLKKNIEKFPVKSNIDLDHAPYLVSPSQIKSIVETVKKNAVDYISKTYLKLEKTVK